MEMLEGKHLISRTTLKATICQLIGAGDFTIVSTATHLGTSPRSLQRQLEILKMTYSEIVDEVRHELARELLTGTDLSIAKIGASLGYRDPSSFSRAFLRWSGTSPREYRGACRAADDTGGAMIADPRRGGIVLSSKT